MSGVRLTVIRSATEGPGDVGNVLCKAEIGHLDVAIGAEKNVLRLEVTIDDVHRVEVVEGQSYLCRVKLGD